jgi:hypothetical protein
MTSRGQATSVRERVSDTLDTLSCLTMCINRATRANCSREQDAKPRTSLALEGAQVRQPGYRLQGGFDGFATNDGFPG